MNPPHHPRTPLSPHSPKTVCAIVCTLHAEFTRVLFAVAWTLWVGKTRFTLGHLLNSTRALFPRTIPIYAGGQKRDELGARSQKHTHILFATLYASPRFLCRSLCGSPTVRPVVTRNHMYSHRRYPSVPVEHEHTPASHASPAFT